MTTTHYRTVAGEIDKVRLKTFFTISAEKTFVLSSSFLYPAKTYLTMVHKYFLNKEVYMPVKSPEPIRPVIPSQG